MRCNFVEDKQKEILEKLSVIDLNGANFWIVNLNPRGGEDIGLFQQKCIENRCFAMCWRDKECDAKSKTKEIYCDINLGDYVIWRDKKSICRIGRVSEKCQYDVSGQMTYCGSYYCKVSEWKEYANIKDIPTEVWARFTQRHQSTIQRIADAKVRIFIMKMYHSYNNLKYYIDSQNYVRTLNYYDLEDVVSIYIHKKLSEEPIDSDYVLLPSTGKSSRQNYEFDFIDIKGNGAPISCQVKNQEEIDVSNYENTAYSNVYLFSGIGYKNSVQCDKIKIIEKEELFEYVKDYIEIIKNKDIYSFSKNYTSENFINDCLKNYSERKKKGKWKEKVYDVSDGFVSLDDGSIYFFEDFQAIVVENESGKKTFESIFCGIKFEENYKE